MEHKKVQDCGLQIHTVEGKVNYNYIHVRVKPKTESVFPICNSKNCKVIHKFLYIAKYKVEYTFYNKRSCRTLC